MTDEAPPPQRGAELASQAGLRASHVDRDRVVELLRVAAGDGRLTAEKLDERLEAALTARTHGELAALTTDLPAVPDSAPGHREPKDQARIGCHGSSVKRDGRWLVPQRMEVRVTGGSVTLDFTKAVILQPSLLIDADVSASRLTLVTKPGVVVDTDEVAAEGSYVKVRAHGVPKCPSSCGSRCPARSAAATSRHARRAGPSGRGCGAIPSPTGLPHVLATLWSISDTTAPNMADITYTHLLHPDPDHPNVTDRPQAARAPYALHHAVTRLRRVYPGEPLLWAPYIHLGP